MGVDATLMVLADYSTGERQYGTMTVNLNRDHDDWSVLDVLRPRGRIAKAQLPQGSWVKRADGTGCDDENESGWLFGDSYNPDRGFTVYDTNDLAALPLSDWNKAAATFIATAFPDHRFVIIWH